MTANEVAHKILNRRNSVSPVVMIGELQETLGQEGYELAMAKGWVEPNYDSGELSVTESYEKLEELRNLAAGFKSEATESVTPVNNLYRMFASMGPKLQVVESFTPPQPNSYEVGDEVVVAENGQPVKAVVQAKNPDGTYRLSFGDDNGKPKVERPYKSEELKRTSTPAGAGAAPVHGGAPAQ